MRAPALLLSFCFPLSTAFYFHAGEREEKCIIEDIPSDTLITGRWCALNAELGHRAVVARPPLMYALWAVSVMLCGFLSRQSIKSRKANVKAFESDLHNS